MDKLQFRETSISNGSDCFASLGHIVYENKQTPVHKLESYGLYLSSSKKKVKDQGHFEVNGKWYTRL